MNKPLRTLPKSIVILLLLTHCIETDIDPIVQTPAPPPVQSRGIVELSIQGEDVRRTDWVQAEPASRAVLSRLVSSRLENQSGSVANLLEGGIVDRLHRNKLALRSADTTATHLLTVQVHRMVLLWQPPQQFIQSPTPHRNGEVRVDFRIETTLLDVKSGEVAFVFVFEDERTLAAQEEARVEALNLLGWQTLSAYIDALNLRLAAMQEEG